MKPFTILILLYVTLLLLILLVPVYLDARIVPEGAVVAQVEGSNEFNRIALRDKIKTEFGSTSPMVAIVKCESKFRQFNSKGKPLISPTSDVGIMQINQVHWKRARKLGLDIFYSVDDNIKMGKTILKEQGLKAWTCNELI